MKIIKNAYTVEICGNILQFYLKDKLFLTVGASASVNGDISLPDFKNGDETTAFFSGEKEEMTFTFLEDSVKISYTKSFDDTTPIFENGLQTYDWISPHIHQ